LTVSSMLYFFVARNHDMRLRDAQAESCGLIAKVNTGAEAREGSNHAHAAKVLRQTCCAIAEARRNLVLRSRKHQNLTYQFVRCAYGLLEFEADLLQLGKMTDEQFMVCVMCCNLRTHRD